MGDDKKNLKTARTIFNKLKTDPSSVVFAEEILDKKLLLKLKKSKHVEYKKLVNLNNSNVIFEPENVKRTDYVEKNKKLISLDYLVLMLLSNYFMQVLEIQNFQEKMLLFCNMFQFQQTYFHQKLHLPNEIQKSDQTKA